MVEYRARLAAEPDCADALWDYGEMLRQRGHFERALECLERLRGLEGAPRPGMAHRMAVCCSHLGGEHNDRRAVEFFEEALRDAQAPGAAQLHRDYGLHLLRQGRYAQAWPHCAWRQDQGDVPVERRQPLAFPAWDGGYRSDAVLVVHGEKSAGDDILFAAWLPALVERARASRMRVQLACRPSLVRLFRASFPSAGVMALDACAGDKLATALGPRTEAWQVALGDLPLWLPLPGAAAYLRPQGEDLSLMCAQASTWRADLLRVGWVWETGSRESDLPTALLNAKLQHLHGLQLASLQPAEHRDSLAALADVPMADCSALLTDFSRTAALMQQLDTVVASCGSAANLAGALGLDTRVLLPMRADWRWRNDAQWYARITTYQQSLPGDWTAPLDQLLGDLRFANLPEHA